MYLFDDVNNNNNFIIDFDTQVKWLGITKYDQFLNNSKKGRHINIDYTFIEIKDKHKPGLPERKYYFSRKAAKEICLMSRKPNAIKFREYLILIDDLLKKYYDFSHKILQENDSFPTKVGK